MNSNNNPDNKEIRVAQNSQISNLFTGLRGVAAVMLITGIVLVIIFSFLEVSPLVEWGVLLLFGVASGGYLMGRARSILTQIEAHKAQTEQREIQREHDEQE